MSHFPGINPGGGQGASGGPPAALGGGDLWLQHWFFSEFGAGMLGSAPWASRCWGPGSIWLFNGRQQRRR